MNRPAVTWTSRGLQRIQYQLDTGRIIKRTFVSQNYEVEENVRAVGQICSE